MPEPHEFMTVAEFAGLLKQLLAPLVRETRARQASAGTLGQARCAADEEEVAELEKDLRQSGCYSIRISMEEKDAIDRDRAEIEAEQRRSSGTQCALTPE